jgi:hypothetical protein
MQINTLLKFIKYIGFKRIKQFIVYNIPYNYSCKNDYSGTIDDTEYEGLVTLARLADKVCPEKREEGGLSLKLEHYLDFQHKPF